MVTELGQDSGRLVMQLAGDHTTRGSQGKRETMMETKLQIIKLYYVFNESISFNMCFHFLFPAVGNNLDSNI